MRAAPAVLVLTALSGCVTTQQKNARTLLINARTVASQSAVAVTRQNPSVAITGLAVVRAGASVALIVNLRNTSSRPLTDLPISVGVTSATHHRRLYLNRAANLDYFATHIAAIGARAAVTWVFTDRRRLTAGERPFAEVGVASSPPSTAASALPAIDVARAANSILNALGDRLQVSVSDSSGVPQYGLQVYAVAIRAGRYVGAGRATIATLDGGGRVTLRMKLLGTIADARVRLFAPPTIFN